MDKRLTDSISNALLERFKLRERYEAKTLDQTRKELAKNARISADRKSTLISVEVDDWDPVFSAQTIGNVVRYKGHIEGDTGKPDGAPRKLMDFSRLGSLGWQAEVRLEAALAHAYANFVRTVAQPEHASA